MGNHRRSREQVIKGPGHRNKFDVRRLWECPSCGWRVRTGGHVVNLRCAACQKGSSPAPVVWMKLVEGPRQPPRPGATPERGAGPDGDRTSNISEVSHVHGNLGPQ